MTDADLASLAAAFRGIIEEQGVTFRAQLASLQTRLDDEIAKSAAHRLYDAEARQRMLKTIGDAIGDAVAPRLRQIEQRTAELEQRSMGAAPGAAQ